MKILVPVDGSRYSKEAINIAIDYAEKENVDLMIIGSCGLGKSPRFEMRSVALRVVKHAPCSVYVVKMSE